MDPQQRLMLEIAWEGLERAGYSPASLRGSRSGVFVGVAANEYSQLLGANSVETIEAHFITGNALNVIAGRVAFALGLEGPAMAVDTACSASLVAVHQACQALHSGDCDMALAGGVNVLVSPASIVATSRARMLSADGRCKTFDAAANGYARSEGCGILVLKRLSDAERDGDPICAVITGSSVNQDGASSGLTVPNGGAQQRLIAATLARAGVEGRDVDYLEAHGTGTSLGDPIEVQAAAAAYGIGRDPNRPLLIGSAKTNIGHLESAAGIAGLIKVVLSLQHEVLPQNLHFVNPSPHIPWDSLPVRVVDKAIPWQANGRPRRAGTSSFGFSGTNAHVLIEEAPPKSAVAEDVSPEDGAPEQAYEQKSVSVLPLSGRSAEALTALAQRYEAWLEAHPEADITDVCFTAGVGRSHFEHRAALVVDSVQGARELLAGLAENRLGPGAVRGVCGDPPKTAWLFTGQGSQYPGMARELFDTEPVFADTVKQCAEAVDGLLPRPLLEVMFDTDSDDSGDAGKTLRHTSFAQPALFAVEMGLARLWQSWGIEPDVVLGHSVGQYAAACVAGVFSLEDGARLMAERGRLFGNLPEGGRMVAVFADAQRVERVADEFPQISVAAYNGPNTVLSGPAADLEQIVAKLTDDEIRCTWLDTSHAFHSELLEPALDEFESYAQGFRIRRSEPASGVQPHRRSPHRGNPAGRPVLAAALAAAGAVRRKRADRGAAGLLGVDGDRSATGSDRRCGAGLAGVLGRSEGDRVAAQRHRCPASDCRGAGRDVCLPGIGPSSPRCTISHGAGSNCPPILSSAVASGPRVPTCAPTAPRHPESWVAPRISLPAMPSTPAGGPPKLSRGWSITSSMAPSSFRARHTRRWPLPRSGRRRRCARSSSTSRSSCPTRIPVRYS